MSEEQRDPLPRYSHPHAPELTVVSARTKYDRRRRVLVAQDGEEALKEWYSTSAEALREATQFLDGYWLARHVWREDPAQDAAARRVRARRLF